MAESGLDSVAAGGGAAGSVLAGADALVSAALAASVEAGVEAGAGTLFTSAAAAGCLALAGAPPAFASELRDTIFTDFTVVHSSGLDFSPTNCGT